MRFETGAKVAKDDALSYILSDMKQNEHLRESSELAELVQEHLATMHPGPNRGVKQAGFRVLVTAFMPAVLVEIGFGTNAAEAAYLNDPAESDGDCRAPSPTPRRSICAATSAASAAGAGVTTADRLAVTRRRSSTFRIRSSSPPARPATASSSPT